jgi:hypothetical protein
MPTEDFADSGTMKLTQWDASGGKSVKGTFDLMIQGSHLVGEFDASACN